LPEGHFERWGRLNGTFGWRCDGRAPSAKAPPELGLRTDQAIDLTNLQIVEPGIAQSPTLDLLEGGTVHTSQDRVAPERFETGRGKRLNVPTAKDLSDDAATLHKAGRRLPARECDHGQLVTGQHLAGHQSCLLSALRHRGVAIASSKKCESRWAVGQPEFCPFRWDDNGDVKS
jgi:hypothetical protein